MKEAQVQAEAKVGIDSISKKNEFHKNSMCISETGSRKVPKIRTFKTVILRTFDKKQ